MEGIMLEALVAIGMIALLGALIYWQQRGDLPVWPQPRRRRPELPTVCAWCVYRDGRHMHPFRQPGGWENVRAGVHWAGKVHGTRRTKSRGGPPTPKGCRSK
jgi:hypothetical protein